jgi:hypothetical protein
MHDIKMHKPGNACRFRSPELGSGYFGCKCIDLGRFFLLYMHCEVQNLAVGRGDFQPRNTGEGKAKNVKRVDFHP